MLNIIMFSLLSIMMHAYSFTIGFDRVNRTLCYNNMTSVNNSLAYVDVFTSFGENISFNIVFDTVPNYTLQYVQFCMCVVFQFYSSEIFVRTYAACM